MYRIEAYKHGYHAVIRYYPDRYSAITEALYYKAQGYKVSVHEPRLHSAI